MTEKKDDQSKIYLTEDQQKVVKSFSNWMVANQQLGENLLGEKLQDYGRALGIDFSKADWRFDMSDMSFYQIKDEPKKKTVKKKKS